jgi:hypothetical protein
MFGESDRGLVVGVFALLYYCFLFAAQMPYLCQRCPSQVFRFFQYLVYKQHCWDNSRVRRKCDDVVGRSPDGMFHDDTQRLDRA